MLCEVVHEQKPKINKINKRKKTFKYKFWSKTNTYIVFLLMAILILNEIG